MSRKPTTDDYVFEILRAIDSTPIGTGGCRIDHVVDIVKKRFPNASEELVKDIIGAWDGLFLRKLVDAKLVMMPGKQPVDAWNNLTLTDAGRAELQERLSKSPSHVVKRWFVSKLDVAIGIGLGVIIDRVAEYIVHRLFP